MLVCDTESPQFLLYMLVVLLAFLESWHYPSIFSLPHVFAKVGEPQTLGVGGGDSLVGLVKDAAQLLRRRNLDGRRRLLHLYLLGLTIKGSLWISHCSRDRWMNGWMREWRKVQTKRLREMQQEKYAA